MDTKLFDLADWQRRLKPAESSEELLELNEEILARNTDRSDRPAPLPKQDEVPAPQASTGY